MKDQILSLLRKNSNQSFNARQMARILNLPSSGHKDLRHELRGLVRDGKIIIERGERYRARDETKVVKGVIRVHRDGFGFLIPESRGKTDVFIPAKKLNYALNGDTVLAESFRNSQDGRYEGRIVQIVTRANPVVIGKIVKHGGQYFAESQDVKLALEIYIPTKNLNKAAVDDVVAVKMLQYPGPNIAAMGEVTHVLGQDLAESSLIDAILLKRQIYRKFPPEVMKDVSRLSDEVSLEEAVATPKVLDLSKLPLITIDGIKARDFDDAVCVERKGKSYILYVGIADVSAYVPIGSPLDQEAYRRGTSTYLPSECIPMLPEKLSNGLCSLKPHLPRLILVAEIHYDAQADFVSARYYQAVMVSRHRATYDDVQAFFDGTGNLDGLDVEVRESLKTMKELAEKLMLKTTQRGSIGFDLPEAEVVHDVSGKISLIQRARRFFSHKLIEEFMIAANVVVAQYFTVYGIPALYRVHEQPDPNKVDQFLKLAHNLGLKMKPGTFSAGAFFRSLSGHKFETILQTVYLRSLKQAQYDAENAGHCGLSLQDYSHFTSPIRRYPDLIVHRQLRSLMNATSDGILHLKRADLRTKGLKSKAYGYYSFRDLKAIGAQASRRERDSMESEREVMDVLKASFMKDHVHEKFFARVTRFNNYGITLELEPHFVEGFLPFVELKDDYYMYDEKKLRVIGRRHKKMFHVGDRVWVQLVEVKVETGQILLSVFQDKAGRHKKMMTKH